MKIGFLGAGNMAYALASSIARDNSDIEILFTDISEERIAIFKDKINSGGYCKDISELVKRSEIIFISVKPQNIEDILPQIKDFQNILVSICAGISISKIKNVVKKAKVVRVMPNTPALIGEMAAGVSFDNCFTDRDKDTVISLLSSCGVVEVVQEKLIDSITAISGSGPAFAARIFEAFALAGESVGLSYESALNLTLQNFIGTAKLLDSKRVASIEDLVKMVSSPNGTTVAGREILENSTINDIILKTVERTRERSEELGK